MYKIGLDIGTTNIKCVLFGEGLNAIAEESRGYPIMHSKGTWVEQNADDWWEAAAECIKQVISKSGIDASEIKGVGISGQAPTFLLVDEDGAPIFNSIIWMDRRSEKECEEVEKNISRERLFEITGNQLDAFYLPTKFLWFRKNYPELYRKAAKLLTSNGYVNYKLTGKYSYDRTNASASLLYDIHEGVWSEEILNKLNISEELLPEISEVTDVIGCVTKRAAEKTGLVEGTPVIAGTVDSLAGNIEAGILGDGKAFEATGTSSAFAVSFNEIMITPYMMSAIGINAHNGCLCGPMSTTGAAYQWCRDAVFNGENESKTAYIEMEKRIMEEAPEPTKIIFLPYMAGERSPIWNSDARGVYFGLSLTTKKGHLMRAVMEGTSFALKDNIEVAKKSGLNISSIRSVGGCCKSELWLKIKASIINMPIEIPNVAFGAPAGLALLLMPLIGESSTVQSAIDKYVKAEKVIYPVEEWVDTYQRMFKVYKNVYEHTISDFKELINID